MPRSKTRSVSVPPTLSSTSEYSRSTESSKSNSLTMDRVDKENEQKSLTDSYRDNNYKLALKNARLQKELKGINNVCLRLWVQHVADRLKLQKANSSLRDITNNRTSAIRTEMNELIEEIHRLKSITVRLSAIAMSECEVLENSIYSEEVSLECPPELLQHNNMEAILRQVDGSLLVNGQPDIKKLVSFPESNLPSNSLTHNRERLFKSSLVPLSEVDESIAATGTDHGNKENRPPNNQRSSENYASNVKEIEKDVRRSNRLLR